MPVRHREKKVRFLVGHDPDDLANRLLGLVVKWNLFDYGIVQVAGAAGVLPLN